MLQNNIEAIYNRYASIIVITTTMEHRGLHRIRCKQIDEILVDPSKPKQIMQFGTYIEWELQENLIKMLIIFLSHTKIWLALTKR